MSVVAVESKGKQARRMLFRTRDLLVRQRTQTINTLRGHLAGFGVVAPQGPAHVSRLARALEDAGSELPRLVRELGGLLLEQIARLNERIVGLDEDLRACARRDEVTISASAIRAENAMTRVHAPSADSVETVPAWRAAIVRSPGIEYTRTKSARSWKKVRNRVGE